MYSRKCAKDFISSVKDINSYQHARTQGMLIPWTLPEESSRKVASDNQLTEETLT